MESRTTQRLQVLESQLVNNTTSFNSSNAKVDTALVEYSRQRHNQQGPIELTPRGPGAPQDTPKPQ